MRDLNKLRKELINKERTIDHLITYCSTRTDNNPNYSLLLGAGCSVTSGIRPATKLIEEWKKELYIQEQNSAIEEYSNEKADEYFAKEMWYDNRNPYSALFERKYDLPRQRRMFVEQEVRDKSPSIGYAYLIKLVENNYFKTIFTTNFDDLLNEAFYQFSTQRPLVCAHDSAISSITITSKRPKIIKLHGDYLFDDIKSTLRETESLEENIKNKFSEFAKDYGLIVVGYGGNDRSIVDILNYLLKNEEYFKGGIYWCLRKGSYINEDLRKLLWKDRVYYVEIEGYDELMSQLHVSLNGGELPIDSNYLDQRKDNIIENIINNKFLCGTENKFIKRDLERLKKTGNKEIVKKFFEFMESSEGPSKEISNSFIEKSKVDDFSKKQREILNEANNELLIKNFEFGLSVVDKAIIDHKEKDSFYLRLLNLKAKFLRRMDNKTEAKSIYTEIIKYDPISISTYISLCRIESNIDKKIDYIKKAIEIDPYDSILSNELIDLKLEQYESVLDKRALNYKLEDIEKDIDQSLLQDPSITNSNWSLKFKIIKLKGQPKDKIIIAFKEIIEKLELQDPFHPSLVSHKVELFRLKENSKEEIYSYVQNAINNSISSKQKKYLEFILLDTYAAKNDTKLLSEHFLNIESKYQIDDDYLRKKAEITLSKFKNIEQAVEILESITKKTNKVNRVLFRYLIYQNRTEEARNIFNNISGDKLTLEVDLLNAEGKYKESIELISNKLNQEPAKDLIILKSFCLLKNKEYREAYSFCNEHLKTSNYTDFHLLVNYYVAGYNFGKPTKPQKINEKILNKEPDSDYVKAAAYALLEDQNKCLEIVKKIVNDDFEYNYILPDWPVMEKMMLK